MPWYSLRICCLYAALCQIRDGEADAQAVAAAALQPTDGRVSLPRNLLR